MIIKSHELKTAMSAVSRTANSRSTLPILGHVCIQKSEDGIELATTNLEQMIVVEIGADKNENWESATVDASLFGKFINELPDGPIELTQKADRLHVSSGGFKATFPTMDGADFPLIEFPEAEGFVMEDFASMVDLVAVAASQNVAQPTLNGINLIISDGQATIAATDGTRLSVMGLSVNAPDCTLTIPSTALISFMAIAKNHGEIMIVPYESSIWFLAGPLRMKSQLISARYPDYQQIIPKESSQEITVNALELRQALRSVQVLSAATNMVQCEWDSGNLILNAVNSEMGTAQAVVHGDAPMSAMCFYINGRYFSDIANRAEATVRIQCTAPTRPIVFEIDGMKEYTHIIMPMNMPA